jgi:hypothetical protein
MEPYGYGSDECEEGEDYESCGSGIEESPGGDENECVPQSLSSEYCDAMCDYPFPGAGQDINCNGNDDWDDCDLYYGECYIAPTLQADSIKLNALFSCQLAAGLLISAIGVGRAPRRPDPSADVTKDASHA